MNEHRGLDLMMAFGLGAAAGAITALLLAPSSGEETRNRIGGIARSAADRARKETERAGGLIKDQAQRLGVAIEEGKTAYRRENVGA